MTDDRIAREWSRGLLPLLVLGVLAQEEGHGYAIGQRLGAMGLEAVKGSALYPVLNRLESEGALEARWVAGDGGPGRKIYELTNDGRERLAALMPSWRALAHEIDELLGTRAPARSENGRTDP